MHLHVWDPRRAGIDVAVELGGGKESGCDSCSPGAELIESLPQYEPERLHNSPLALVVAQVQFPAILSVQTDEALLARFQEKVRDRYPFLFLGQQFGFSIGPSGVEQQHQAASRVYQFADAEREWMATLTTGSISLEARNYTDYEDFSERLLRILASVREVYRIEFRQRLGLRYINEIRYPGAQGAEDWAPLINPQLLGPLADTGVSPLITFGYQEVGLQLGDGGLTLRHGHFAQGTTVASPPGTVPQEQGPFYLLDLDAYDEDGRDLDDHTLDELLKSYNHTMFQLLRWGVRDELFGYLKGDE